MKVVLIAWAYFVAFEGAASIHCLPNESALIID